MLYHACVVERAGLWSAPRLWLAAWISRVFEKSSTTTSLRASKATFTELVSWGSCPAMRSPLIVRVRPYRACGTRGQGHHILHKPRRTVSQDVSASLFVLRRVRSLIVPNRIANVLLQSGSAVPGWILKLPKPSKMKRREMGKIKRAEAVNNARRIGRSDAIKKR